MYPVTLNFYCEFAFVIFFLNKRERERENSGGEKIKRKFKEFVIDKTERLHFVFVTEETLTKKKTI